MNEKKKFGKYLKNWHATKHIYGTDCVGTRENNEMKGILMTIKRM